MCRSQCRCTSTSHLLRFEYGIIWSRAWNRDFWQLPWVWVSYCWTKFKKGDLNFRNFEIGDKEKVASKEIRKNILHKNRNPHSQLPIFSQNRAYFNPWFEAMYCPQGSALTPNVKPRIQFKSVPICIVKIYWNGCATINSICFDALGAGAQFSWNNCRQWWIEHSKKLDYDYFFCCFISAQKFKVSYMWFLQTYCFNGIASKKLFSVHKKQVINKLLS